MSPPREVFLPSVPSKVADSDFNEEGVSPAPVSVATEYGGGAISGRGSSLFPSNWEFTFSELSSRASFLGACSFTIFCPIFADTLAGAFSSPNVRISWLLSGCEGDADAVLFAATTGICAVVFFVSDSGAFGSSG